MIEHLNTLFQSLVPLWEMSLTAAYAAAVVIVLRLLLKKRAPRQLLCLLWLVVFARLLIPVSLESPLSIVPSALPVQEQQEQLPGQAPAVPAAPTGNPAAPQTPVHNSTQNHPIGGTAAPVISNPTEPALAAPGNVAPALPQQAAKPDFPWRAAVAGVWLAGAAVMGGWALVSYLRLRRRLFDGIRAKDGAWEHPAVESPFILGMLRPRIYLPAGLAGQPRQFILCHERAHLRRLDHIVKPVCWIALALHWFNPLVWAAFILMSRDIESACDEAVVRQLGSEVKADYSATLLALAHGRRTPSPCPLAFDEGDAKGRIQNVLRYRRPALWVIVISAAAAVLAAVCLLTDPVAAREGPDPSAAVSQAPEDNPRVAAPRPTAIDPDPGPAPVCLLRGEDIVSLCGTAFCHNAMITADSKLLAWGETPFDLEQCVLRQENDGYLSVYELPLENVTGAWLGRSSILALDKDGVLWGTGSNYHGQLWDVPKDEREGWTTPLRLTDHVVSAAILEWYYSAVLKDDGGVWLMGSSDITVDTILPPTRITEVEGAVELYADRFLYARDKDGVSWRLGEIEELLNDPTALMSERYSGIRWLAADLWITDEGDLVRMLPNGEERTLLTNVADADLSYGAYATAVTKDGELYVWSHWAEGDVGLSVYSPTKVMEGVRLAGAWEFGVVAVTETDGTVWAIYKDTLEAALANNALITPTDPVTSLDALLDPWMKDVLYGVRTFRHPYREQEFTIHQLRSFYYGDDQLLDAVVEPGRLAILDLDHDGANELVIWPEGDNEYLFSAVGLLVLRRQGDTIYGYNPSWRTMGHLKADGTFDWSSSAFNWGIGSIQFTADGFEVHDITWCDNGDDEHYFVDGQKATREEFDTATNAHFAKPDAAWYTYSGGILYGIMPNAPLDAPLITDQRDIPEDPDEWYKVAELPDSKIWMFSRNHGSQTLLRWGESSYQSFDHAAHAPVGHIFTPVMKRIGPDDIAHYGPLAVINHLGGGSGESVYGLVVYDLDTANPVDYVHDWKPLAEDFNRNHTFQYDNDTHLMTLTYQGQTVATTILDVPADSYDRIEREGCSLSITGEQVHYSFEENADGSFQLQLGAEFLIGGQPDFSLFPVDVAWTLRFNGSGFDVVPGSCQLLTNDLTDAPLATTAQDIPNDPDEWYKVAELPDSKIWLFTRNHGSETLLWWGENSYKLFDHAVHNFDFPANMGWTLAPYIKKLDSFGGTYGPLAVIGHIDSNSSSYSYTHELVVYDLDAAVPKDYVHDWKPLVEEFNANCSYRYDRERLTFTYQGHTVKMDMVDDGPYGYDRISREGLELRLSSDCVDYFFDPENSDDIYIRMGIGGYIGDDASPRIFLTDIQWALRFNGSGFDVVPGSCSLNNIHNE